MDSIRVNVKLLSTCPRKLGPPQNDLLKKHAWEASDIEPLGNEGLILTYRSVQI